MAFKWMLNLVDPIGSSTAGRSVSLGCNFRSCPRLKSNTSLPPHSRNYQLAMKIAYLPTMPHLLFPWSLLPLRKWRDLLNKWCHQQLRWPWSQFYFSGFTHRMPLSIGNARCWHRPDSVCRTANSVLNGLIPSASYWHSLNAQPKLLVQCQKNPSLPHHDWWCHAKTRTYLALHTPILLVYLFKNGRTTQQKSFISQFGKRTARQWDPQTCSLRRHFTT